LGLNSLRRAEGGDRRTFREALHFLTVEIVVGRVAFLPDVNATGSDLESLGLVQTTRDEREEVKGYGVEEDIGVPRGTDADTGARWGLHGSLGKRAGLGGGEVRRRPGWSGSKRSEGDLMVRGSYLWF
jgi:hypothetical protein